MTDEAREDGQGGDLHDATGEDSAGMVATELHLMRALVDVGERMNSAATAEEVGAVAIDAVRRHLGARGGAFAVADHLNRSAEIIRVDGYDRSLATTLRAASSAFAGSVSIPFDAAHPISTAIRDATTVVELDAANDPEVGAFAEITGDRAFAVIPLELDGTALGALCVAFTEPTLLSRPARMFLEALVGLATEALRRTMTAESDRRLGTWLARIQALSQDLSAATTVDEIVEIATRWFEQVAHASLVEVRLDHMPTPRTALAVEAVARRPSIDTAAETARSRRGPVVEHSDTSGTRHLFATRLRDGTDELGVLVVELDIGQLLDDHIVSLLESVATQLGPSIRRALLARRDTILVDSITTQLVPERLPRLPAIELAAVYVPAETRAGGDWYDAFSLPGGHIGLVIGDVAGHGPEAAAAMTNVRTATRAEAMHGSAPSAVLAGVDAFLCHFEGTVEPLVTEVVVSVDPGSGALRYSNGGHPPPLLVDGRGNVRVLEGARGLMLGTEFSANYESAVDHLEHDAALVLYTDGLVERRGEQIEVGFGRLLRAASRLIDGDDLAARVERLVDEALDGSDRADDVAVLVAVRSSPWSITPGHARATLAPDLGSVERARTLVAELLGSGHHDARVEDALLLTSELATNAVRHAQTVYDVVATVDHGLLRVEVVDLDRSVPQLLDPEPDEPTGRGMLIVDRVADRWGTDIVPSAGKVVWCELELDRPRSTSQSHSRTRRAP